MSPNDCNIAKHIPVLALKYPQKVAIHYRQNRRYQKITFLELEHLTNSYAEEFILQGITKGQRVIVLVPHGLDFYAVMFALFKIGSTPVVIDPGMRKKDMLSCIKEAEAQAFIGIPFAHCVRMVFASYFKTCHIFIMIGKSFFWTGSSVNSQQFLGKIVKPIMAPTSDKDLAAILFTSGSTGIPKGVEYEHGMFEAQVKTIQDHYQLVPEEVDLPCFPLFGLFSLAMGLTIVIPEMNPSKPVSVNPLKIIRAIEKFKITNSFASPAVWDKVSRYCEAHRISLPSLKKILSAGAPIPGSVIKRMMDHVLPLDGDVYTPYGATEALPVTSISGRERINNTQNKTKEGAGICVGKPMQGVLIKIIPISEKPIPTLQEVNELPIGVIGEILVQSKSVTKNYYRRLDKTQLSKIKEGAKIWHRMGDVGYIDEQGFLWFCGRKDHRVILNDQEVLYSIPCEEIYNLHPKVYRTALVSIKANAVEPVLIVELFKPFQSENKSLDLANEILALGEKYQHTKKIQKLLFHHSLPVDVRHNAKINREWLAEWATKQKKYFERIK